VNSLLGAVQLAQCDFSFGSDTRSRKNSGGAKKSSAQHVRAMKDHGVDYNDEEVDLEEDWEDISSDELFEGDEEEAPSSHAEEIGATVIDFDNRDASKLQSSSETHDEAMFLYKRITATAKKYEAYSQIKEMFLKVFTLTDHEGMRFILVDSSDAVSLM
jgi:hypothetical protein